MSRILWLADEEGWAYDSIVQNISKRLPQYEHEVWYMMGEHSWNEWVRLGVSLAKADVIVSMHWKYQEQIVDEKVNVVTMLTGLRAL